MSGWKLINRMVDPPAPTKRRGLPISVAVCPKVGSSGPFPEVELRKLVNPLD